MNKRTKKYEKVRHLFEEALAKNFNHIISWLMENEWVFTRENTQDCLDNAPKAEYPEEDDSWDDEDYDI